METIKNQPIELLDEQLDVVAGGGGGCDSGCGGDQDNHCGGGGLFLGIAVAVGVGIVL